MRRFKEAASRGPDFVCICCERAFFKNPNQSTLLAVENTSTPTSMSFVFQNIFSSDGKQYLCRTCHTYLLKKEIPPLAAVNNLFVDTLPAELDLNCLEGYLLSPRKLFAKIVKMPRGEQSRLKGSIVNVPIPLEKVFSSIKKVDVFKLIMVKYKRKLEYKTDVCRSIINVDKIKLALQTLIKINPFYKELKVSDFLLSLPQQLDPCTPEHLAINEDDSSATSEETENGQTPNNVQTTVFDLYNPIQEISRFDDSSKVLSIAPGQGQLPRPFYEENVEYRAFPTLLHTGKFGWHAERPRNLSASQYFSSRLLHHSGHFASCSDYVFFAQHQLERERIRNGITTALMQSHSAGLNASKVLRNDFVETMEWKQKIFHFMSSVPGTPAYWHTFLYELLAMTRQLGVPQFWHTITCADLEWK